MPRRSRRVGPRRQAPRRVAPATTCWQPARRFAAGSRSGSTRASPIWRSPPQAPDWATGGPGGPGPPLRFHAGEQIAGAARTSSCCLIGTTRPKSLSFSYGQQCRDWRHGPGCRPLPRACRSLLASGCVRVGEAGRNEQLRDVRPEALGEPAPADRRARPLPDRGRATARGSCHRSRHRSGPFQALPGGDRRDPARSRRRRESRVDRVLRVVVGVVRGIVPLLDREPVGSDPGRAPRPCPRAARSRLPCRARRPTGPVTTGSAVVLEMSRPEDTQRERVPRVRARIRGCPGDAVLHRALQRRVERPAVRRDRDPLEPAVGPEVDPHRLGERADDHRPGTRRGRLRPNGHDTRQDPAVPPDVHDAREVLVGDPERAVTGVDDEPLAVDATRARAERGAVLVERRLVFGAGRTEYPTAGPPANVRGVRSFTRSSSLTPRRTISGVNPGSG